MAYDEELIPALHRMAEPYPAIPAACRTAGL